MGRLHASDLAAGASTIILSFVGLKRCDIMFTD